MRIFEVSKPIHINLLVTEVVLLTNNINIRVFLIFLYLVSSFLSSFFYKKYIHEIKETE